MAIKTLQSSNNQVGEEVDYGKRNFLWINVESKVGALYEICRLAATLLNNPSPRIDIPCHRV